MDLTITREQYAKLLDAYGLWGFPRRVGTPYSQVVASPRAFFRWFDQNYDDDRAVVPMFIGHSGYAPQPSGQPIDQSQMIFSSAFGDFDTGDNNGTTPEEVMSEVQRITQYAVDRNWVFAWKYSGSLGGFHLHVKWLPEMRRRDELAELESTFWRGLQHELDLHSINIRCANPVCLERLPYTRYVHKKDKATPGYKVESNYCVPVPWQMALNGKLDRIVAISQDPVLFPLDAYVHPAPLQGFESFVRSSGWRRFNPTDTPVRDGPVDLPTGPMRDLMKLYMPYKLCLQQSIFEKKPRHIIRHAWIAELFRLRPRPSLAEAQAITDRVADEAQWVDRRNVQIRHSSVEQAWRANGGQGYIPYRCDTIREGGECLGKVCPLFARMFPDDKSLKVENA